MEAVSRDMSLTGLCCDLTLVRVLEARRGMGADLDGACN